MDANRTSVANLRHEEYDVYIGRKSGAMHFGNPFSHLKSSIETVHVKSREEAVAECRKWLDGTAWNDLEQERRKWILGNMETLRGMRLGCFCRPKLCHGELYVEMLEGKTDEKGNTTP